MTLARLRHLMVPTLLVALAVAPSPAAGQQAPVGGEAPRAQPKSAPKTGAAQPSAQARPAAAKEDSTAARGGDAQLRQRIEQLEEQLADMQVAIGTLESLARGASGGQTNAPRGGGVDQARLDSLETQIQALTAQLEQLAAQVRQAGRRGELPPPDAPPARAETRDPRRIAATPDPGEASASGFGSLTVRPGDAGAERDPIGRVLSDASAAGGQPLPAAAAGASNPKQLYETAYGYLLQQDYGAAEAAFEEFLRRYPNDRQTADAQYWLGETLYVQRRYKPAGQAFLRVIERHQTSSKVPNSLLKLAMTLEQLGQKDCSLFTELEAKHPNAPADVKARARSMKQRVGC